MPNLKPDYIIFAHNFGDVKSGNCQGNATVSTRVKNNANKESKKCTT
jgi:hypothetical protein